MSSPRGARDLWQDFVRRHWERDAALLADEQARLLPQIEPDRLFRAVTACARDFAQHGRQKVRLYVDNVEIDVRGGGHEALLPSDADRSFEGYDQRMTAGHGLPDYALVVADWHQFDRGLWERLLAALKGLTDLVGISRARMDTQVFLGTYRVTPFGVHADPTSVFHVPLVGTKKMRFWQDSFVAGTPALRRAQEYSRYLDQSVALTAHAGQILYWPASYWHVGESDGAFSVTWGVGYWFGDGIRNLAIARAMRMFETMSSPPAATSADGPNLAARGVDGVDDIVRDLHRVVSSEELRRAIARTWLEHHSAQGFLTLPSLLNPVHVNTWADVRLKPGFRILAAGLAPDTICAACAGRSCLLPFDPAVFALVDALNHGGALALDRWFADAASSEGLRELLSLCLRTGAVDLRGGAEAPPTV